MKRTALFVLILALLFCGCSPAGEKAEFWAMDTLCSVTVYGSDCSAAQRIAEDSARRAESLLGEEHGYLFFAGEDGQTLTLSDDAVRAVSLSLKISEWTGGAFDITVAPLSALWNIQEAVCPPSGDEIGEARSLTGYQGITLDGNRLTFSRAGMGIDLGAVGKGFAAASAYDALCLSGVKNAVLNFGGNVTVIGDKNGKGYQVGIRNPAGGIAGVVSVSDASVVTSGGYERYFEYEGRRYHHILDPRTGYPAESDLLSATVVSSDHILADILSTAFFVCGSEESRQLYERYFASDPSMIGAVLLSADGEVTVLGNVDFRPIDSSYSLS